MTADRPACSGGSRLAVLLVLMLAGSAVRLWFGLRAQAWDAAPDQIAWGVLLAEAMRGPLRWDQLIHYPHEGGTLIASLMALPLGAAPLGVPALSWVALLLDTIVRAGMVLISWRSLGYRTAILFAAWSVFAVPSLLPWATVNVGLHGLAAFWPFAALWVVSRSAPAVTEAAGLGVVTGLGLGFSYDALALVPASCGFELLSHRGWQGARACAVYLVVTAAVVAPHVATRVWLDSGFALSGEHAGLVRGLEFRPPTFAELTTNTRLSMTRTLPGASLLPALGQCSVDATRSAWGIVAGLGLAMATWQARRQPVLRLGLLVGASWVLLYAASPVFVGLRTAPSYLTYRHAAAVLPVLMLLALHPAATGPRPMRAIGLLLVSAGIWSGARAVVDARPPETTDVKAAGWILGSKLGHDPARLEALLDLVPAGDRPNLAYGFGWGIAASVLAPASPPASAELRRLTELVIAFSSTVRPAIIAGAKHASAKGVTPEIDPAIARRLRRELRRSSGDPPAGAL